MSKAALLSKIMNRLGAGDKFPSIFLKDTEDKTVCIPEEVNTKYCVLLFFRGVWWPVCTLQLEGYRKYSVIFEKLDVSIIAASVDSLEDTKRLWNGECFPYPGKELGFTLCYGVSKEISDSLGAYYGGDLRHRRRPNHRDYMQPAEFVIDINSDEIIICSYSDGAFGRMNAGDVIGYLSQIENRVEEFPHVWSWWSTFTLLGLEAKLISTSLSDGWC